MKVNTHSDDVYDLAGDIAQLLEAPDKAGQIYQGLLDCMRHAKGVQGRGGSILNAGEALHETLNDIEEDLVTLMSNGDVKTHRDVMNKIATNFGQNIPESQKNRLFAECETLPESVWESGHLDLKQQPLVGALFSIFVQAVKKHDNNVGDCINKLYDVADMLETYDEVVY